MATIYEHDSKELFRDEADAYAIEDVRIHYAQFDKRLMTATYTVIQPGKGGEPRKVIFAKKTGTKGIDSIIAILLETQPVELEALAILDEFLASGDPPDPAELLRNAPQIEAAINQIEYVARISARRVNLLCQARPVPAPITLAGF